MFLFWVLASALAGGAAALIAWTAARRARAVEASEDPLSAVYKRQLAEVRELAERGLIGPDEQRAAEAEAGRRLLVAADTKRPPWRAGSGRIRPIVFAACAAAAVVALALYLVVGRPGAPDQPFKARLTAWRQSDPARLSADRMSAVLASIARERPRDPQVLDFLGRAQLAAGEPAAAVQTFQRAARLAPGAAPLQAELGEAITLGNDGKVSPEALLAFRRALALDPRSQPARYFLGRARSESGDAAGALALWRPLAVELPPDDPRRPALEAEIARMEGRPPPAPVLDAQTAAMARGMVARLAARLRDKPDDPEGWARLVRAYGVLGDVAAQADALKRARTRFAGRPAALRTIEQQAGAAAR